MPSLLPHLGYFPLVICVTSGVNWLMKKRKECKKLYKLTLEKSTIEVQAVSTHFIHGYQFSVCLISRKSLNTLSTATDDVEAIRGDNR